MVWVQKDIKGHLVPISLAQAGTPFMTRFDQAAQSPIQNDLEHFQTWASNSFSGQSVLVPHPPSQRKISS